MYYKECKTKDYIRRAVNNYYDRNKVEIQAKRKAKKELKKLEEEIKKLEEMEKEYNQIIE